MDYTHVTSIHPHTSPLDGFSSCSTAEDTQRITGAPKRPEITQHTRTCPVCQQEAGMLRNPHHPTGQKRLVLSLDSGSSCGVRTGLGRRSNSCLPKVRNLGWDTMAAFKPSPQVLGGGGRSRRSWAALKQEAGSSSGLLAAGGLRCHLPGTGSRAVQLLPPLHAASSTGRRLVSSLPGPPCPGECHPLSASPMGHWPFPLVSRESALYMEAYVAGQEGGSWQGNADPTQDNWA